MEGALIYGSNDLTTPLPLASNLLSAITRVTREKKEEERKMLSIFHKAFAHPPPELHSSSTDRRPKQHPQETLEQFISAHSNSAASSIAFDGAAILAYAPRNGRLFCGYDDIYCLFNGSLNNLCALIRQYGLYKTANEAMLMIEAFRTLRDRCPYPADQVVKDLDGSFAFVVFDPKAGTVFAALGSDGRVELFWGVAGDGSVVISDDIEVMKAGCGKSFAPFPRGCMFHSEGGLRSFEHPMNKMKAVPRIDSEGAMCGANFKVDDCCKISSMPRVGSEVNWSDWVSH